MRGLRLGARLIGAGLQGGKRDFGFGLGLGELCLPVAVAGRHGGGDGGLAHGGLMRPMPCDEAGNGRSGGGVEDRATGDEGEERGDQRFSPIGVVVIARRAPPSAAAARPTAQAGTSGR